MSGDTWAGRWKRLKGQAKENWGKLTDDDLMRAEGNRDQFIGRVQERYGLARDEAERQVDDWLRTNQ